MSLTRSAGALKASIAPGRAPLKTEAALRVAVPLLTQPVADRTNWTLARLVSQIEACEGVTISRSRLSKVLRKKGAFDSAGRATR